MSLNFYLHRTLSVKDKTYSEASLLVASRFIVVLAEPGAGKTRLMESLAQQQGALAVTANRFVHTGTRQKNLPLFIDAYDELAKVDASGIYKLLGHASEANPSSLVISSRSSEWDNALTSAFEEFFGEPPFVARLLEFNEDEQQKIFENHVPNEKFSAFQSEVIRFDLDALLPNPQFLMLFADAYVQSGRKFTNKKAIFSQAVERLAKEANATVRPINGAFSIDKKVNFASEVFAKLLLSGAEGVATSETSEDMLYPLAGSLVENSEITHTILSTRMFKPGDKVDTHRPVHKIVAEYAAAGYLAKRAADPADTLTLENYLPLIAPNSIVRDELRGLLGWMASLGNKHIQEAAIELDPYAVLANGDPSQLEPSSKRLLLKRLEAVEEKDPYFRRADLWRRFSVAGFFTSEVVEEIKSFLSKSSEGHLRDLMLELLDGSPAIKYVSDQLRAILLFPDERENTRLLALNCLLGQGQDYEYFLDLDALVCESSQVSMKIVAKAIERLGPNGFDNEYLLRFFTACADLYPSNSERFERRKVGDLYFVNHLVNQFDLANSKFLLNGLFEDLICSCSKRSYECDCRNGLSKIIGMLLDRYFMLESGPHDPIQVWSWIKGLNFHATKSAEQSKSVEILQEDTDLRQGIIKHVFGTLEDRDEILEKKINHFDLRSHSGLRFLQEDYLFIIDYAFDNDNTVLWSMFKPRHQFHRDKEGSRTPDNLRRHMREQASKKTAFMCTWTKSNREEKNSERKYHSLDLRHSRRIKRMRKQKNKIHEENIKYVHENREQVEGGQHWGCLVRFADLVLMRPDNIQEEFGNENIVRNGLRNCLGFIEPHVPDLGELAKLQCESKCQHSETVLYAACLEIIRRNGNLNEVPIKLLLALRTNIDMHYDAVQVQERDVLIAEINRLAFSTTEAVEYFCRHYIEPQLRDPRCNHPQLHWLRYDPVFQPIALELAYQWLYDFSLAPLSALETLFEIISNHGDQERIKQLITVRSDEILSFSSTNLSSEELTKRRKFWFVRAFYFLENIDNPYWNWLKSDKENLLLFNEYSGSMNRSHRSIWPSFTAEKIEAILDAFFIHWPKVFLPSSWGTGSPKDEVGYRFFTEIIWVISADDPDKAITTLKRLLDDIRYLDLHKDMKSMLAGLERKVALRDFEPPIPSDIVGVLDHGAIVTVEGLRQKILGELSRLQKAIDGGEFNTAELFYAGTERLDEEPCTRIIAERLSLILEPQNITVIPEHHLKYDKRCDFTTAKMLAGKRRLLVTEVKGQWHSKLYEAASNQLNELYAIHPDAEQQGIYLVLWFGTSEKVAGKKKHQILDADGLKVEIEHFLPTHLKGLIDVFVLDVSKKA